MGKLTIAVGIVVAGLLAGPPARAAESDIAAEITAAQKMLDEAFVKRDAATLKRLTTPDHVSVTPSYAAALSVTEQAATIVRSKITAYKAHTTTVTPLGPDAGMVTMIKSYRGTFDGKPLPAWVFATAIWIKRDGSWRERLYQETAIKKP
jgi:ketosteroid isomerase-like protein